MACISWFSDLALYSLEHGIYTVSMMLSTMNQLNPMFDHGINIGYCYQSYNVQFHLLITGKVEIGNFCCLIGIFEVFYRNV